MISEIPSLFLDTRCTSLIVFISMNDSTSETPRGQKRLYVLLLFVLMALTWPAWSLWQNTRNTQYQSAAEEARDSQDWERLEVIAQNWLNDFPGNGYAWLFKADSELGRSQWAEAAQSLGQLSVDDPKYAAAMVKKIDLEFQQLNDPLQATDTAKTLLKHEPLVGDAHQRLIFFYGMTYQRQKLVDAIRFAMENRREPKEAFTYLLGRDALVFSNAYDLNQMWSQKYPEEELFQVAAALSLPEIANEKTGRPGRRELMQKYLEIYPQNLEVICYAAEEAIAASDVVRVAELLREIPESYLQDNRIWRFKGWLEKSQGQLQQAENSYQQSLIIHPADWRSQVQLSEVYRLTGKPEKGKKLAELGSEGKELESIIMALPSVDSVPVELALRMADYFEASGDTPTAELMRVRIS